MDLEKYRMVISDAVKSEIEAKQFYEKISHRIKDSSLKELFKKFAKEEEGSCKIVSTKIIWTSETKNLCISVIKINPRNCK